MMPVEMYTQQEIDAQRAAQAARVGSLEDFYQMLDGKVDNHSDILVSVLARLDALENEPQPPPEKTPAQKLLELLISLPSRETGRVISGQNIGYGLNNFESQYNETIERLHTQTGLYPGLIGATFGLGATPEQIGTANIALINHWRSGGIITVDHQADNPWTGGNLWDLTDADLGELLDPTTEANRVARARYLDDLDRVATGLAQLRDAGVPVLWRPFHEANWNDAFWWNWNGDQANIAHYISLWREMYEHFANLGLDNLVWVYAPASATQWNKCEAWYPGNSYVDVVGLSVYSDTATIHARPDLGDEETNYTAMLRFGKPFCFSEFGPATTDGNYDNTITIDAIRERYPKTTYFLQWHSWTDNDVAIVDCRNAAELMTDQLVLSRGDFDEYVVTDPE